MPFFEITDDRGVVKEIPVILGPSGEDAYDLAVSGGFSGSRKQFGDRMCAMANPYEIGAIYYSTVSTSPSSLFGGSWTQISNVFLLAAGSSYAAGSTGGEATHTLTTSEMPSHTHTIPAVKGNGTGDTMYRTRSSASESSSNYDVTHYEGDGGAHNNMPPYLVVYAWKRVS